MKKFCMLVLFFLPIITSAHEAYVVPHDYFWQKITGPYDSEAFRALENPHDVFVMLEISLGIFLLIIANYFFRKITRGKVGRWFEKFSRFGPLFVRFAIAGAFFLGAVQGAFLGSELSISSLPHPELTQALILGISILFLVGFLTELAALIGLVIFALGFSTFGLYLATYLNYLGELLVLFLFGMREYSIDKKIFGSLRGLRRSFSLYGTTIMRMCYGAALMYAGFTVKLLHSDLTLRVINDWHLTQFHWLFPSDPLLVVLGGGLAEMAIGLFIMLGFELRMTVLISLFYITLSLIYFQEIVWPHILLYGISLNLLVEPEVFTIDHLLFKGKRKGVSILSRITAPRRRKLSA